jgi:hypothetical protein
VNVSFDSLGALAMKYSMKYLGGILMFMAVITVSKITDWKAEPDRTWQFDLLRIVTGVFFLVGLYLYGHGIKREIIAELHGTSDKPAKG